MCCCWPVHRGCSREKGMQGSVDTLLIDEAGQVALADALAVAGK